MRQGWTGRTGTWLTEAFPTYKAGQETINLVHNSHITLAAIVEQPYCAEHHMV